MSESGFYANDRMTRTFVENRHARRRCPCCGKRAGYVGLAGGMAMMSGCEWSVRKWCQDPRAPIPGFMGAAPTEEGKT